MNMIKIPAKLDQRLDYLAGTIHQSKNMLIKQALYEFLEDKEDYLVGVAALEEHKKNGSHTISLDELCKKLGIDDLSLVIPAQAGIQYLL